MKQMIYVGDRANIKGKSALVIPRPSGEKGVLAQFDVVDTGLGHGWHPFREEEFIPKHDPFKNERLFDEDPSCEHVTVHADGGASGAPSAGAGSATRETRG